MTIAVRSSLPVLVLLAAAVAFPARATEPGERTRADAWEQADAWAQAYRRCAACHLPDGRGVPGAYPPLDAHLAPLFADAKGRAYLVLVLAHGLMGPLKIEGIDYRNVMPAQENALGAAGIAAALNHVAVALVAGELPKGWRPFTTTEVAQILAAHSGIRPADVHALRRGAFAATTGTSGEGGE